MKKEKAPSTAGPRIGANRRKPARAAGLRYDHTACAAVVISSEYMRRVYTAKHCEPVQATMVNCAIVTRCSHDDFRLVKFFIYY